MKKWFGIFLIIAAAGLAATDDILEDAYLDTVSCTTHQVEHIFNDSLTIDWITTQIWIQC